jgi:hypothetical protein
MPIDLEKAVGAELPGTTFSWGDDDVILYHLGVGAGVPPTDPRELRYAYEGDLWVLPTYATIPQFPIMMSMGLAPGFDINPAMILHGEHEIILHDPIPTAGTVTQTGRVTEVLDKGKGALAVIEVVSVLEKTGLPLFTNRASIFIRGEGGFGGDSGPPTVDLTPERAPDHVVESPTLPQQALLYRMARGTRTRCTPIPGSPPSQDSTGRSCTGCAPLGWCARRRWTTPSKPAQAWSRRSGPGSPGWSTPGRPW